MVHSKRGFRAALFGLSLMLVNACDGDDSASADDISERDDNDGGDIVATGEQTCERIDDAAACIDKPGCAPVFGKELLEDDIGWCTEPSDRFIACMTTTALCTEPDPADCVQVCPSIEQTVCIGDTYYRAKGCVPDHSLCTTPGAITGDCG